MVLLAATGADEVLCMDEHGTFAGSRRYFSKISSKLQGSIGLVKHLRMSASFLKATAVHTAEGLRNVLEALYGGLCLLLYGPGVTVHVCLDDHGFLVARVPSSDTYLYTVLWRLCVRWVLVLPLEEPAGRHIRWFSNNNGTKKNKNRYAVGTVHCYRNKLVQIIQDDDHKASEDGSRQVVELSHRIQAVVYRVCSTTQLEPIHHHGRIHWHPRPHHHRSVVAGVTGIRMMPERA